MPGGPIPLRPVGRHAEWPDVRFRRVRSTTHRVGPLADTRQTHAPMGVLMHALSGYLEFPPEERETTLAALQDVTERSRRDPGCVDYWWAEDVLEANRFRFFECWESEEAFDAHQAQEYEQAFMTDHVSRITGADAHILAITGRRSALGA